jgi:hypothetical protein
MWDDFDVTHQPAIQTFIRDQKGVALMPKPTTITAVNRPSGAPGSTTRFQFLAAGIDGWADGYAGLEFPKVPGTGQTYYGPASNHDLPRFQDGVVEVDITIPEPTTPIPADGVTGEIFIQIVEIDGTTWDGGRFPSGKSGFPITILAEAPSSGGGGEGSGNDDPKDALDELWALGAAFGANGDMANEAYIKARVVRIKDTVEL